MDRHTHWIVEDSSQSVSEPYWQFNRASPLFDIVIVAIPFLAILFNRQIGPLTPLLVLSVTPIFIVLRWERLYVVLAKSWPLLLLPALAIISVLWSESPATTMRYSILYFFTVLPAIFVGAGCDRNAILKGIFLAFAFYTIMSLIFGRWVHWGGPGGKAFAGLLGSKNASGDAAALTVLISATIILWAHQSRRLVWITMALLIMPMALYTLWASKATGALIATIISIPCLILWSFSRRLDLRVRNVIFIVAILVLLILLATFDYWMVPLFDAIVEHSGKDKGLTGRDFLWRKADELIREKPWIGHGYRSFWVHNNLDAEYLWREMGIASRQGYNFHNTPRDILVALGVLGLTLFSVVVFLSMLVLFLRTMRNPHYTSIYCCTLLVFESPRVFFEMLGFSDMHFSTIIIFIVLGYGLRPKTFPAFVRYGVSSQSIRRN